MHVIWSWWGQGLPLGIEFTEHAHTMATMCLGELPPEHNASGQSVHKACDPWVLQNEVVTYLCLVSRATPLLAIEGCGARD